MQRKGKIMRDRQSRYKPRRIPGSKSVQVSFSLSEYEYQTVKQAAMSSEILMSEWIRRESAEALQLSIENRQLIIKIAKDFSR
jgi:hypothetical protein